MRFDRAAACCTQHNGVAIIIGMYLSWDHHVKSSLKKALPLGSPTTPPQQEL